MQPKIAALLAVQFFFLWLFLLLFICFAYCTFFYKQKCDALAAELANVPAEYRAIQEDDP